MNTNRITLTAVTVYKGIITVILPNGTLGYYAQRGLNKYSRELLIRYISEGKLDRRALTLKELPRNVSIEFEDPLMGRAYATFNPKRLQ